MSVLFGYLKKSSTWLIHRLCSILNFIRSKCNIFKHSSNSARNFIEFNFTQNLPGLRLEFDKMTATKINHPILSSSHCSSHQSSSQVDLIAQHLREAQHSIDIAVFTFSEHRLYNLVLRAYRSGICVRLLTDAGSERTPGSSIPNLRADGVNVRTNATGEGASDRNLLHLKFAVIDRKVALFGTTNWTQAGLSRNEELIVHTRAPALVDFFACSFEKLWSRYEPVVRPASAGVTISPNNSND